MRRLVHRVRSSCESGTHSYNSMTLVRALPRSIASSSQVLVLVEDHVSPRPFEKQRRRRVFWTETDEGMEGRERGGEGRRRARNVPCARRGVLPRSGAVRGTLARKVGWRRKLGFPPRRPPFTNRPVPQNQAWSSRKLPIEWHRSSHLILLVKLSDLFYSTFSIIS